MENQKLVTALKEIHRIASEALKGGASPPTTSRAKNVKTVAHKESLADRLTSLRNEDFFKEPKTAKEVHAALQGSYACDVNRVAVALYRLAVAKQLRKTSKTLTGKRQLAYVW